MQGRVSQKEFQVKVVAVIFALLLVSAAPVPDAGLAALAADDARVATVAWRLQTASIGLCKTVTRLPGFTVHSLGQYAPQDRERLTKAYGLGSRPAVLAVVSGGAAAKAGLQAGDAIVTINGQPVPVQVPPLADYFTTGAVEAKLEQAMNLGATVIEVRRGATQIRIAFEGDKGCASSVQIVPGTALGGQADGRYVQLTGASVAFTQNNDALAALMAHELAHNFLQHRARLDAEGVSRGALSGFGKSGARFRATEYEADRLSVWVVARSGYDLDAVVPFWTAWAKRRDPGPFSDGTHPNWKSRIKRIAAAVAEVKAQKAADKPLMPPSIAAQ